MKYHSGEISAASVEERSRCGIKGDDDDDEDAYGDDDDDDDDDDTKT